MTENKIPARDIKAEIAAALDIKPKDISARWGTGSSHGHLRITAPQADYRLAREYAEDRICGWYEYGTVHVDAAEEDTARNCPQCRRVMRKWASHRLCPQCGIRADLLVRNDELWTWSYPPRTLDSDWLA